MKTKGLLCEQARANVRQAILDAARVLFREEGYAGLSMRRLADIIGYTPKTIYLYFADKDDLLSELIEEGVEHLNGGIHGDKKRTTSTEKIHAAKRTSRPRLVFSCGHGAAGNSLSQWALFDWVILSRRLSP